jgi:hypothetical protein
LPPFVLWSARTEAATVRSCLLPVCINDAATDATSVLVCAIGLCARRSAGVRQRRGGDLAHFRLRTVHQFGRDVVDWFASMSVGLGALAQDEIS